jgi:hypothetical protein
MVAVDRRTGVGLARGVVGVLGGRYSTELGIDVDAGRGRAVVPGGHASAPASPLTPSAYSTGPG